APSTLSLHDALPIYVLVEAVLGPVGEDGEIIEPQLIPLQRAGDGHWAARLALTVPGEVGYTVRVTPQHPVLASRAELGLVATACAPRSTSRKVPTPWRPAASSCAPPLRREAPGSGWWPPPERTAPPPGRARPRADPPPAPALRRCDGNGRGRFPVRLHPGRPAQSRPGGRRHAADEGVGRGRSHGLRVLSGRL